MKSLESEKVIERKLVERVKKEGGLCIKLLTSQYIGLPDRLCLFPSGRLIFVELKSTGQKPRKIQLCIHNRLRNLGFQVEVIDKEADIEKVILEK